MEHIINHKANSEGHIKVLNLSAWWIPEPVIVREIGGTEYTVTSGFEGSESLMRKLERISAAKFTDCEG